MIKFFLKPRRDDAVKRFHPWVFSGAILKMDGKPDDGDTVEVVDHQGNYLATGHYQQGGSIIVRIFSFEKTDTDAAFWAGRFTKSIEYRRVLGLFSNDSTTCYRLVHAEGDGLPGLIIDVYNDTAVVQCHSIGMHRHRNQIAEALVEVSAGAIRAVYDKSKDTLPGNYAREVENGYLLGNSEPQLVKEYGHSFFVDWEKGQKTGFFLDQRENRRLLDRYTEGKTVLNTFAYSGGFSIYALAGGAKQVHSVDASEKAVEWTRNNLVANGYDPNVQECYVADVLKYLKDCPVYDVMVVDPPAFAKNISKRHNAVQGYKRLNMAALQKVAPGGVLFTFSCSQVVDRQLFYDTIVAASIESGRQVRVMHHLSQPADHPVSLFHPEGAYLKGLALWVE